jgi:excinuclease ABC subunit C
MSRLREGLRESRLFTIEPFLGFGPSRFRPSGWMPTTHTLRGRKPSQLLPQVRATAPLAPGVYGMLDRHGRVIYIGKAKCLRRRLLSYFRSHSRDPKAGKILQQTRTLLWEQTADEFSALLRELELIHRLRPRMNVQGQPGQQRYVYLCVGRAPAPSIYLARSPQKGDIASYGPLIGRGQLDEAVRRLNDWFQLRDCSPRLPMRFSDQASLFPEEKKSAKCLRYELATCLGPCAGYCSRSEYAEKVRAAVAFLDGHDRSLLQLLETRMSQAAQELRFEQAMADRDRWKALKQLDERLTFLRAARQHQSFIYPLQGSAGSRFWYLIDQGDVQAVIPEPHDSQSRKQARELIEKIYTQPRHAAPGNEHHADSILLVAAWFRKHPEEKHRLLPRADAIRRCTEPESTPVTT